MVVDLLVVVSHGNSLSISPTLRILEFVQKLLPGNLTRSFYPTPEKIQVCVNFNLICYTQERYPLLFNSEAEFPPLTSPSSA